jgi:hypothetical protein
VDALVEAVGDDGRRQRKMRVLEPQEKKKIRPIRCVGRHG